MDALLDMGSSVAGYSGALVIASAYFLNQAGRMRSDNWRFPALNLFGSLLVLLSLAVHVNLPSVVIELFWASISLFGVWRARRLQRRDMRAGP